MCIDSPSLAWPEGICCRPCRVQQAQLQGACSTAVLCLRSFGGWPQSYRKLCGFRTPRTSTLLDVRCTNSDSLKMSSSDCQIVGDWSPPTSGRETLRSWKNRRNTQIDSSNRVQVEPQSTFLSTFPVLAVAGAAALASAPALEAVQCCRTHPRAARKPFDVRGISCGGQEQTTPTPAAHKIKNAPAGAAGRLIRMQQQGQTRNSGNIFSLGGSLHFSASSAGRHV